MSESRVDSSSEKFLIFTWQPARVLLQGDACGFTGADNEGNISYDKNNKFFKFFLTAGAKLKHDRQWELISVQALTGGVITLFTKDPVGADEQATKPVGTIAANTEEIFNRVFGAGEELIIKSADAPASVMFLVREYNPSKRGM